MWFNWLFGDDFKFNCFYYDICLEGLVVGLVVGKWMGKVGKDIFVDDLVWLIIVDYIV